MSAPSAVSTVLTGAAPRSATGSTGALLVLAAFLVGIAAVWVALEVRRAWSPESLRAGAANAVFLHPGPACTTEGAPAGAEVTELHDARRVLADLERIRAARAEEVERTTRTVPFTMEVLAATPR